MRRLGSAGCFIEQNHLLGNHNGICARFLNITQLWLYGEPRNILQKNYILVCEAYRYKFNNSLELNFIRIEFNNMYS
jgi:hypothetical protein